MTAINQREYMDWATNNNKPSWSNNKTIAMGKFLLAANDTSSATSHI
jgi:hypothetical protein